MSVYGVHYQICIQRLSRDCHPMFLFTELFTYSPERTHIFSFAIRSLLYDVILKVNCG